MTTASSRDTTDLLAGARALRDVVAERAEEIEAARRLPADLSRRFAQAGFYRSCVPEAIGGLECAPMETARVIETLAEGDGSAAWCVFIGATSGSALAALAEDAAREVFATPETLLSGVFAPHGRADWRDGSFRASGRWAWGSGTQNADWVLGGCRLFRDGEPWTDAQGAPRTTMLLVPAAQVRFLDTWHVSGLCGTGSTDFEWEDVVVPERHAVGLAGARVPRPLYAFPNFGLLAMGVAAVTLGLARHAIDALVALAASKRPASSQRTLAERPGTWSEVATAEAGLRSARAFFYESLERAWESACREGRIGVDERRDLRLATTWAARSCAGVVDRMYDLGGGSSVYRSSPLQRIFRDVHVATQHMMVAPSTFELTGRLFVGVDTDTRFL